MNERLQVRNVGWRVLFAGVLLLAILLAPRPWEQSGWVAAQSTGDTHYLSFSGSGSVQGIAFEDEDILAYDAAVGAWSLFFDGSDVGLASVDLKAFALLADGSLLLSPENTVSLTGAGSVANADIVQFFPASLGEGTNGTFSMYFDGSDVEFTANSEAIDAISFAPDGRLLLSTIGGVTVTGASGFDEDIIAFTPAQLGATTGGTWSLYFDGSDVGLSTTDTEDINAVWVDSTSNQIYLSTIGEFAVTGASGDGTDIFICTPGSVGNTTTCSFTLFWDGSDNGFAGQDVDGFARRSSGSPPPPPSITPTSAPQTATFTPSPAPPTTTPTATTIVSPPTNTPAATAAPTATVSATGAPPSPTPSSAPGSGNDLLYFSSPSSGTAGGVSFSDEDILAYYKPTGAYALILDGSDVGLGNADIDAFERLDDGSFLLSLDVAINVPGLGYVQPHDIIRFLPFALGGATDGSFEWYFDGSDVELASNSENIDALDIAADGRLLISTNGAPAVTGVTGGADEDLLAFSPTSLGTTTAGSWSLYFDGSDVALSNADTEDVDAVWIDSYGSLYLSTLGSFSVPGVTGDGADIFQCQPGSLGSTTSCTFGPGLYLDGSAAGFAGGIDGLEIVKNSPAPVQPGVCQAPTRIMPLGDSITRGQGSTTWDGYRRRLFLGLTNSGYGVDFVGGLQDGNIDFDRNHEGHGGWHAAGGSEGGIAQYVYSWLAANPADVVLLHIGTNDISNGDQSPDDVALILDEIDRYSPNVKVVLALIVNRKSYSAATTQYNAAVQAMANARIAAGDQLVLVDMESALDYTTNMYDNVHPNNAGYTRIATVWQSALDDFLPKCP